MSEGVNLGVVFLCHNELEVAAAMVRIWHDGGASVAIHVDQRTDEDAYQQMQNALADLDRIVWVDRHKCDWGMFSMVEATQAAAQALLDGFSDVSHVFVASGACLPLRPVAELCDYLRRHPRVDFIESVSARDVGWTIGGLNIERFEHYFPFSWRKRRALFDLTVQLQRKLNIRRRMPRGLVPHLGSQWWCLTRETLYAILTDPRRSEFERYFRWSWIPDESYFQTLTRRHSTRIESRTLTLSKFDFQGRPYTFYGDHQEMLTVSRCFVARKIWPGAQELMNGFPKDLGPEHIGDEPDPGRIDRLIASTVARRQLGRPGLYMQSRFPKKDRENGKTAGRYAVLQGFTDLFPDFEEWLQARVDADVHGHLFDRHSVEFLGRQRVGPGGIPAFPECRDYDPHGFLTSLIRIADREQVFQFSPRDTQDMNWFMVTDPNAVIRVVTGAWVVPLMHSDMPFDDIRNIAARLQHTELEQLKIMRSVWVKADIEIWELADFVARPAAILQRVVRDLTPGSWPLYDQPPPLRDLDQLGRFLQRLRNAGLQPRLMGGFPATRSEEEWNV
ncbi:beta-1,6-N-acetylglucosaminyltransferase [Paracoccus aurantiacus]|uniref:Peptide O-xylosyltransferase n=1 Tax=Paracoccus aurantiacus TaxID=2599412 RepID=A0A5C6S1G0_9RHOB|nr:beta-1,6-N-acetylglucosaminyltransferase [Paracoccus aurantiacus]TXB68065.1 beta-1,6-N-acetylglucosaminyltransferase [Paracoccus aurantiacus]